jgi:hypothetical protein
MSISALKPKESQVRAPSFSETLFMALHFPKKGLLVFQWALNVYKRASLLVTRQQEKQLLL